MEEALYDDLLVELECPICTNYMSPPIRQCSAGHSICDTCCKKLPKCALCQGKFTESRNIALEGLAVKMRYPCINKMAGCAAKLSYTERETHELRCGHKGFKCAMEKCPWIGKIEDLAAHWASKKMTSKPYHKSNVCHTKIKAESYYVNMISAYGKLFWFKCKLTKNKLYWAVQYIGNAAEAENFHYEIEMFKPGKSKKKIVVSDYCQAIELQNSQLFTDDCCISINMESVGSFVSEDQLLLYYMRVYPVDQKKGETQEAGAAALSLPNTPHRPYRPRDHSRGPPGADKKDKKRFHHNKNQAQKNKEEFVLL